MEIFFITIFVKMISVQHKAKQKLVTALKVLVLVTISYVLFQKLNETNTQTWNQFRTSFSVNIVSTIRALTIALLLTTINWIFEILKWKTLVSNIKKISYHSAFKQTMAAHSAALITPARAGDYGVKAIFSIPKNRKKIVLYNFYGNITQLVVTILFGAFGLLFIWKTITETTAIKTKTIFIGTILLCALLVAFYLIRNKTLLFKGLTLQSAYRFFKEMNANTKYKVLLFSVLRYLVFSSMFYFLLCFFGEAVALVPAIYFIFSMYLLVSILPTFFIFDVLVRGGVAVWLFSFLEIPEITVLCTVLTMWLFNFVLPAVCGSYYIASYKHKST